MTEVQTAHTRPGGSNLVHEGLRAALDRLDQTSRHLCGYHLGFWDADGAPDQPAGKGVRGTLALLSARAGGAPAQAGVPAAVAVELVHNFSLLHDDLMDHDPVRRHRPTVWARFGNSAAILAGDAMLGLATEVLAEAPSPTVSWALRCLAATTRRLIAGQCADLAFESRTDVTLTECLQMADNKTGSLLSCAASLGAVLVDAPAQLALDLAEYGTHLGLAFQVCDDLLGIWGCPEVTGKPVLADLRARKKSLPVVAALEARTPAAAELAACYFADDELADDELAHVAELVAIAGGRAWAEKTAAVELTAALTALSHVPGVVAAELEQLARGLAEREC